MIIAQKIRGGKFALHSELKLEIAEAFIENLTLCGSLHIAAEQIMGHLTQTTGGLKLEYSEKVGSVKLRNVVVENRGYDSKAENSYWKEEIQRHELCQIFLRGNAEFIAENITMRGSLRIEVEDGTRLIASEQNGEIKFVKEKISENKRGRIYTISDNGCVSL